MLAPPAPPARAAAAAPSFAVSYVGSGSWATRYHSTPPNPGGAPDTDDAHDTSTEAWRLSYGGALHLGPASLEATHGSERLAVKIDHVHVDGLYAFDNASERCGIRGSATSALSPPARIVVARHGTGLVLSIESPLDAALLALPAACPSQGDPLDGLSNDYGTPGFSFADTSAAERWMTGRVTVPVRSLQSARHVRIRVRSARPVACRAPAPSYERCTTGGRWSGVLTLTRRS